METYRIHCIVHDDNKVITNVGIGDKLFSVQTVVDWIRTKTYGFYTDEDGVRAEVYAKQHPTSGRWFLTTKPDSSNENNLDFIRYCK